MHEHDKFAKKVFSDPAVFRDLLEQLGPAPLAAALDLSSLELVESEKVTPEFQGLFSDLVFKCRLGSEAEAWLVILFEHKSFVPRFPHVQILQYQANRWAESDGKTPFLAPIIPVVLYHGLEKWRKKPFAASFGEQPKAVFRFLPSLDYALIDLSEHSISALLQLRKSRLQNILLALRLAFDSKGLRQHVRSIFALTDFSAKTEAGRAFASDLYRYFCARLKAKSRSEMDLIKEEIVDTLEFAEERTMLDYMEELAEKRAIEKGKIEGKIEGKMEVVRNLIAKMPFLPDAELAEIAGCPLEMVAKIRADLAKKN